MARKNTRTATIKVDADVRKAIKGMNDVSQKVSEAEAHMLRWGQSSEKVMAQMDGVGVASSKNFSALGIGLGKAKAGLASLIGPAKAAGVAIAAIGFAATKVAELADQSLKTQAVFNNLKFSIEGAAVATGGIVDKMTLAEASVRAFELGAVDSQQQFEDLAEAGAKLGLIMGGDAAKGVDDLATALSRGSGPILDNLGITLSQSQAQEIYAEQLGKTVSALTDAEKAEAFRVVGLQKALEAAREKNIEDSLALDIKRAEVKALDEITERMGGQESAQLRLTSAIESMGDEVIGLDIEGWGADMRKAEKAMRIYGVSIEEAGGKAKVQAEIQKRANEIIREQKEAAEAAAEAERERADAMRHAAEMAEISQDVSDLELELRIRQAEGSVTAEQAADLSISLANARLEQADKALAAAEGEEALAKATGAVAKAEEDILIAEARRRGMGRRRGRGGGRRKDPLADLFQSRGDDGATEKLLAEWEAEDQSRADRQLQFQEDLGALRMAQIERERAAEEKEFELRSSRMEREIELRKASGEETEFLERRLAEITAERLIAEGDLNAAEQAVHDERMRRLEDERKEREKLEKVIEQGVRTTVQGLAQSTEAAVLAKNNKGAAFAAEVSEFAGSRAKILAIDAATHFALAAAYAIALNPVKAAAELAAGAKSSAAAAAMGALAAATGAAGGAAGGGGVGGSSFSQGPPNVGTRPGQANSAPVSPLEQNGQPAPQSGDSGGQVINLNVAGSFIDSGGQLQELISDASANGGRGLRGGLG